MKFNSPLQEGILLKRYKRFFADVKLGKETVVAHVPNSGSMKGCSEPGSPCLVTHNPDPARKLKYTLEMVKTPSSWVGVNTSHPNKLVEELFHLRTVKAWSKFDRFQREVKISAESRIDMVLWSSKNGFEEERITKYDFKKSKSKFHLVEVKNVSMALNDAALFPDSVTERGQKHIRELVQLMEWGHTVEMVYVIQREDCKRFSPAEEIDPEYAKLLRAAAKKGLQISAYAAMLKPNLIELHPESLKVEL